MEIDTLFDRERLSRELIDRLDQLRNITDNDDDAAALSQALYAAKRVHRETKAALIEARAKV